MQNPSARSLAGGAAALHVGAGRVPDPQGPPPPLPNGISFVAKDLRSRLGDGATDGPAAPTRVLRGGCYYLRYTPLQASPTQPGAAYYLGTLRVQTSGSTVTVSGDLYLCHVLPPEDGGFTEPDPADGIPIFPRKDYRYYLRATHVTDGRMANDSFALGIELYRFNSAISAWTNDGEFKLELSWTTTPPGFPSEGDYLAGEVKSGNGAVVGNMTLGWVSSALRRATLEIDKVREGVFPENNGDGIGWKEVFDPVGWDLQVVYNDGDVSEASGESWADAEMHEAMIRWRDHRVGLLDFEWRYHMLCVRLIDGTERGIMYDSQGTDSNYTPREGVGIACDWRYPEDPEWGTVAGKRFGDDSATYFRTAVHELGHAMGLRHNRVDTCFMNTTDTIARRARPERPFPQNVQWGFNPDDEKRLRHMPDIWVRPGGIAFGTPYSVAPIAADDLVETPQGLVLEVSALEKVLPIGAPARITLALRNTARAPISVPKNLSLRGGEIEGKVIDPSGTVRTILPLVQCLDNDPLWTLQPGEEHRGAETILRGPQGALFPTEGMYRIIFEVRWERYGRARAVTGSTDLLVTGPRTDEHARAAYDVLSTPDTLLTIAAASHSPAGIAAIESALADQTLAPHYSWVGAKRALRGADSSHAEQALDVLCRSLHLMSFAERERAAALVGRFTDRGDSRPVEGVEPPTTSRLASRAKEVLAGLQRISDL